MEIKQAIEIVEQFNKWRRGAELPHPNPIEVGIAIDVIINELHKYIQKDILIKVMKEDQENGLYNNTSGEDLKRTYEVESCGNCSFCVLVEPIGERCTHPDSEVEDDDMPQYGQDFIPEKCPLKVNEITIKLVR
jgi:hypothetical protein